jgi:hypothetical protein
MMEMENSTSSDNITTVSADTNETSANATAPSNVTNGTCVYNASMNTRNTINYCDSQTTESRCLDNAYGGVDYGCSWHATPVETSSTDDSSNSSSTEDNSTSSDNSTTVTANSSG